MNAYEELLQELQSIAVLESCGAVLDWDEQTFMPPGGAEHRSAQLSLLAGMVHERATSPRLGDLISSAEEIVESQDPDSSEAATLREARRQFDRATKIPRKLVEELSRVCSLSQQAWVEARDQADFQKFLPWLEQVVALRREEAEVVGFGEGVPYDALLDEYEPGMTAAEVQTLFSGLRDELVPLIAEIVQSGRQPDLAILQQSFPIDQQRIFSRQAAQQIGFDFSRGRLDESAHPFNSSVGPGDTRMTTRYDEFHFPGAFFGTLHEAGHGIYEQGLNAEAFGTPLGRYVSLGIHESQSRLWENFVGRSRSFWRRFYPEAQQFFPNVLSDVSLETFYACVNDVRPSAIRVEADEATYNLHILLRFELEQPLISGDLSPADVPIAWNEKFTHYFGMTPPDDAQGCLQDIHWSRGGIGYFPTYTLGNMYAAQFFAAARRDLGDLDEQFSQGEFVPLRTWLNEQIHQRGQQYRANRLVEIVTGEALSYQPLMKHLRDKYSELYGLNMKL